MRIHYFGHACVGITASDGTRILLDPYEPGGFGGKMNYPKIESDFDGVVCSHDHDDHSSVESVSYRELVHKGTFGPFVITRVQLQHDEYEGRRFGGDVDALVIDVDGFRVVHLSDVGHEPSAQVIEEIGQPDVLLCPVGGYYTIGAHQAYSWARRTHAKMTIPIHYATPACKLPIRGVEPFLVLAGEYKRATGGFIDVESVNDLPPALLLFPAPE